MERQAPRHRACGACAPAGLPPKLAGTHRDRL